MNALFFSARTAGIAAFSAIAMSTTALVIAAMAVAGLNLPATTARAESGAILLQSTTSTANSGLLDHLLPIFTGRTGIKVGVVAVGTGQALKNGRNGDGDVLLVHAKAAEEKFVAEGYGVARHDVMYNDFIIVGPASDPAGISGLRDAVDALRKIARPSVGTSAVSSSSSSSSAGTGTGTSASASLFVSRGDNSGTHKRETELWAAAGIDAAAASGTWYRETGTGMGATLNFGIGMGGYVLTDRASWTSFRNKRDFKGMGDASSRLCTSPTNAPIIPKTPAVCLYKREGLQETADNHEIG